MSQKPLTIFENSNFIEKNYMAFLEETEPTKRLMRQTFRFPKYELKDMKEIKDAISSYVKATIKASKERKRFRSPETKEIDQHAPEDGRRSEKGATRVDLFPYVSERRDESCKSVGLEIAE